MITRCLMQHPMISGFKDTGAIEDEGQFLQSVLPVETSFGGVGRFGFDPRAHMTEASALNSVASAAKLASEWGRHWDQKKPVLIEKTPSNLLRMRLLQEFFERSYFIVVTRHPIATSLATMKWTEGNLFSLLQHWVHCYRIAREDTPHIERVLWVSYEGFVAEPERELTRMAEFVGLSPVPGWSLQLQNHNLEYFALWRTQFLGDTERSIEQTRPDEARSLSQRLRGRWERMRRELTLPTYRRRSNLRSFYDALDAVSLHEQVINEFGYSFLDLARTPSGGS